MTTCPAFTFRCHFCRHTRKRNNGNSANVLIILHYLTKLLAFMAKVKKALRIIEKRCNAFYSSEVVTRASQAPIFMIVSVTYYISLHVGSLPSEPTRWLCAICQRMPHFDSCQFIFIWMAYLIDRPVSIKQDLT